MFKKYSRIWKEGTNTNMKKKSQQIWNDFNKFERKRKQVDI